MTINKMCSKLGDLFFYTYERKTTLMNSALPYDVNPNTLFELGLSEGK